MAKHDRRKTSGQPPSSRPVTTQVPLPVLDVTNGPLLELSVNGRQTRDELRVTRGTPLAIEAAQPGVRPPRPDRLRRLSRRRKPADGTDAVALSYRMAAEGSMWIAVRASGEWDEANNMTVSYSAPIYVVVGNESTWKRAAVPELIAHHRAQLQAPLSAQIDPQQNLETWKIATTLVERWRERGAPTHHHLPNWPEDRIRPLMETFGNMLIEQRVYREVFGVI